MSKQQEALRLALEALDCIYSPLHVREINKVGSAMTAIREALAQPAQQPHRKPLTDEELAKILGFWEHTTASTRVTLTTLARAIEAAHGITGEQR